MASGVIASGANKDRFKKTAPDAGGSANRFSGCIETQMNKGLSKEAANRLCAFIARRKAGA